MPQAHIKVGDLQREIVKLARRPEALRDYLDRTIPALRGPSIESFAPREAYAGTMVKIQGRNFSSLATDNVVTVGGKPALVVGASATELKAITDPLTVTGPLTVKIGSRTASGPYEFRVRRDPSPGAEEDGPPIYFQGAGQGQAGDVPATGTLNVLVVLVNPTDGVPANPANTRTTVANAWNNVHQFYDQASYARLNVQVDLTANWHTLTGSLADYVTLSAADADAPNIRPALLDRLMAEAAQAAVDEGFNLDNYAVMACVINLNGTFIRAWGGWSSSNFSYNNGAGTNINLTANHALNLLAIQESANWGRCAHELGHNIVSAPTGLSASPGAATLGEDVYQSDLVDPASATAAQFEMMGSHDSHPLFSAYYLHQLGYYLPTNILDLQWDRNAFSQEYEVVAHGLAENTAGARYHLIKIQVAPGLYYYVEVRQRPGATAQIFDPQIPLAGAPQQGGVVVTKVLTDVVNMNQQLRFITLLHAAQVLKGGEVAVDPARALKITVVNDQVSNRPLVCRVRVEWAQGIANDPNGAFDLRVEPWGSNWQTPDIWVDRAPFGVYDQAMDPQNRPTGNGDKPRPNEVNHLWGRVHCDGTVGAANVLVTFYAVDPPGVGDNGNWAPIETKAIPNIGANGHADVDVNWVPVVGRHTCLKVWASQQLGEITGGNNWAQENVFQFEAPAASVPAPVTVPVAVRNPLKRRTLVLIHLKGVPQGYTVYFPHAWLWLDPLKERRFELTVIPTLDYSAYRDKKTPSASVRVTGDIPRSYREEILPGVLPGSRMRAIGGITAVVTPKRKVELQLEEDKERSKAGVIAVTGSMKPAMPGERLRVDVIDPQDRRRVAEATTNAQGQFGAQFNLKLKPSLDAKPNRRDTEEPLRGVYSAQAFVIDSPNAAEASSNLVHLTQ